MTAPADVVLRVIGALERLGIPYHVGGSFASSFYGQSRMTADLDLGASTPVYIKRPEDLVLSKLEWFRLGGEISERQWSDVVGILRAMRGRLEEHHLDHWAAELGLTDLLERAREESARG